MSVNVAICKYTNRFFPLPSHPFNMENSGTKTYEHWQYEKGEETIKFYLARTTISEMFQNKVVLDVGCGAAGKTLYYASQGVKKIYGLDIIDRYESKANDLAVEKGLSDKFSFILGDASQMVFDNNFFDAIIMNDAMEHVDKPMLVLQECYRVLKPGGRLYVNFPPYFHPFGAHLSDAIGIPWVHIFFNDKTLIKVYSDLVKDLPDGMERINFRISSDENGNSYFSYINKMTIKKFCRILKETDYNIYYYKEIPLRTFLSLPSRIPVIKETLVKMVVCIMEK